MHIKHIAKNRKPVTGIILAGGKSRRMGQNKALLRLGDKTLIEHVICPLREVTDELLLITKSPQEYAHLNLPMHDDILPNAGALGGLHAGLTYASHELVLCVACDSPFLQPALLTYLISAMATEDNAVVPYTESEDASGKKCQPKYQTLCAVYSKRCLPVIEQMVSASELRVHQLYRRIRCREVPPAIWRTFDAEGVSFFNVNTRADFVLAQGEGQETLALR